MFTDQIFDVVSAVIRKYSTQKMFSSHGGFLTHVKFNDTVNEH